MFLVYSKRTKAPYIDTERQVMMFEIHDDAQKYIGENTDLYIHEDTRGARDIFSDCYSAGAVFAYIKKENKDGRKSRIQEEKLRLRFYNGNAAANISLYISTKDPAYLRALREDMFIVPINITNHPTVRAVYLTVYNKESASEKDKDYYYVAFTDLREYEKWGREETEWAPLLVDFKSLGRIGRNHGFIINVMSTRFLLSRKKFEIAEDDLI